ncbi:MAG: GNAT family N-acetyltransferase [Acidobacteria bacterium]|nr:GNAT family N-acetyltransferase [Acidobacteriota bacterium]
MLYEALFVAPSAAPFPREIVRQPEIARYVTGWGRAGDSGFIAAADNAIGAVWIRRFTAAQPGYGYMNDETPELTIAVLSDWRGCGIGTGLMTAMLEAAQRDYPAVSLSVSAANPARHLYERCGFVTEKIEGDSLTMVKHF